MINAKSALAQLYWEHGKLSNVPVIDMHAHMGPFKGGYLPAADPARMVNAMDGAGVAALMGVSHLSLTVPDVGEEFNIASARKFPGRIFAYHCVNSNHLDTDALIKRIEANRDVYVGLKFHSETHQVPIDDPRHAGALEYAQSRGLPVLCHTWGGSRYNGVPNLEKVAARYPGIPFVCGHSFTGACQEGVAMAKERPNIFMELTAIQDDRGAIEIICDGIGSERLLFGVDLPWFSYHHGIGAVLCADINDDDRLNILYRNALKLLSRDGLPTKARMAEIAAQAAAIPA